MVKKTIQTWILMLLIGLIFACIAMVILEYYFGPEKPVLIALPLFVFVIFAMLIRINSALFYRREWLKKGKWKPLSKDIRWYLIWFVSIVLVIIFYIGYTNGLKLYQADYQHEWIYILPILPFLIIPEYWYWNKKKKQFEERQNNN